MPKEENRKNERKEKRNNDHPLELNIPKCDQPKHPKIPKETSLKANQDPRIRTDGPNQLADMFRGVGTCLR
jgi:hypothetical protein